MSLGIGAAAFVGRAAELAALEAAFGRTRDGQPSAALIGGEAGVGKSRFVGEFAARRQAAASTRVLYGYCLELSAEGLPFTRAVPEGRQGCRVGRLRMRDRSAVLWSTWSAMARLR